MMLGDLGAEVIKIEQPEVGDETRGWGPPFLPNSKDSAYYVAVNRNKKSVTLDMKQAEGKEIFTRLIQESDVLVENFRVGTMEKMGFGYKDVAKLNPKIIYCSMSGFGSTGPYRDRGGYDVIIQGMGGLMSITGEPDGPPSKVGVAIVDLTTGMLAIQGILAALLVRAKTGTGQLVETSLLESQVSWLANVGSNYLISGKLPQRLGNAHPNITPYQPYKASDGYVVVAVGNEKLWKIFCEKVIHRPELVHDPRFAANSLRNEHREELNLILDKIFLSTTAQEWTELLLQHGIPAGPIYTVADVFSDPQVIDREMVVQIEHPEAGKIKMAGIPIKFSATPAQIRSHPPLLGEHTDEVLLSLGYSHEQIETFRKRNVI
jgi:formyl-CoA transferase